MADTIFDRDYNLVNLLKENHTLLLGPNKSPDVLLGVGFDINDLYSPIAKGQAFNNIEELQDDDDLETESDPQSYNFSVNQVQTIQEELTRFSLNFSGSYGVISGSVSYETVKTYFEQSNIFYLDFEAVTGAKTIDNISSVTWRTRPVAEDILSIRDRFKQFIADNGSHYVRTIFYGSRVVIRVKTNTKESSFSEKVNLALKAVGASWSAGVDLSYEHQETLKSSSIELSISILGKLKSVADDNKNPVFRAINYDQLFKLIEEIRDGVTKIISCPIKCELETYKYRLNTLPNCKQIFDEISHSTPAESPYGVPSGTIISWIPKLSDCQLDADGNVIEIIPPSGWIICNENSDYNLDGRFLRGVNKFEEIKKIDGSPIHKHSISGTISPYNRWRANGGLATGGEEFNHNHTFEGNSSEESNLPPYFTVIYIIKI